MKMKNKCAAVRLEKSRLLAAMAILAVAFVVLAAVPVAMTDGEAETPETSGAVTTISTSTSGDNSTELVDGEYLIVGDVSAKKLVITTSTTTPKIYLASNAKITIEAKDGQDTDEITITVYQATVSKADDNNKVTFLKSTGFTIAGHDNNPSVSSNTTSVLSVSENGYLLKSLTNGPTASGSYIIADYGDSGKVYWTTATAAQKTDWSIKILASADLTNGIPQKVTFPVPDDETDTNEYTMTVTDGNRSATFAGPFKAGSDTTMYVTTGTTSSEETGNYTITYGAELGKGMITRNSGELTLGTITSASAQYMKNGVITGTTLGAGKSITTWDGLAAVSVVVLQDTTLESAMKVQTAAATPVVLMELAQNLKTTDTLTLAYNNSGTTLTITSAEKWTGGAVSIKSTATVVNLGAENGSLIVDTYATSTAVKVAGTNSRIAGAIVLNDQKNANTTTMELTTSVVTEAGSIKLKADTKLIMKTAAGIDVLGTISGAGEISGENQHTKLKTTDGTKKNVTAGIGTNIEMDVAIETITGLGDVEASNTNKTCEDQITTAMADGYTSFTFTDSFVIPYDEKGYEFPAAITLIFPNNGKMYIVGDSATSNAKEMVVTVPVGTEIKTVGSNSAIVLGAKYVTAAWTAQTSKVTLDVQGKISGAGTITATSTGTDSKATLNLGSNGTVGSSVTIAVPNVTGEKKELHLNGDTTQSIQYPVYQKIYVDEGATWTITDGNVITVLGELEVNGTIVIKDGGELILASTSTASAKATVNGTISMEQGSKLTINNSEMTVSGEFSANGEIAPVADAKGKIDVKGTMTVGATGVLGYTESSDFKYSVASAGTLTIYGYLDAAVIENSGNVVIDNGDLDAREGETGSETTVKMVSTGAVLTIDSYLVEASGEKLIVTDDGLSIGKITTGAKSATKVGAGNTSPVANVITVSAADLADITGELVFTESLSNVTVDSVKTYTNVLQITGSVSNATTVASGATVPQVTIAVSEGAKGSATLAENVKSVNYVSVPESNSLVVGKDIAVTVASGSDLMVLGDIDMTEAQTSTSSVKYLTNSGEVTVEGTIAINGQTVQGSGVLNAAMYVVKEGTPTVTYNVYSSLEAAVENILDADNTNTDKTVTIYGDVVVKESLDVVSPVAIKFATSSSTTSTLTVSEAGTNDVVMTVEDGAKITSGRNQVIVNGTLSIEDKATGDKTTKTICDVTITSDDDDGIVYTNIYTALGAATSGDTVNVTREITDDAEYVELYSSITIGEGVTLVVGDSVAPLYLKNGVTLYVNGTLQTALDIKAQNKFSTQAMNVSGDTSKQASAVIVNGTLKASAVSYLDASKSTDSKLMSKGAPIAGAYYTMGDWSVISTLAIASANMAKITSDKITVHGAIVAGDLTFAKGTNDTCKILYVPDETVASVDTKLSVTSLTIDEFELDIAGAVSGTVKNDSAAVELTLVKGSALVISDASSKLTLVGQMDLSTKDSAAKISAGTVYAGNDNPFSTTGTEGTLTIGSGATMEGVSVSDVKKLSVDGTLNVASGKSVQVTDITVKGTVKVVAGTDTSAAGTFTINGIAGIGISASSIRYATSSASTGTAASASVSGPVTYGKVVIIAAGASVDEDAMSGLSIMASSEFYVEGALWITVYDGTSAELFSYYKNSSIENALFKNWADSYGYDASKAKIGASGYEKVYADIEYDVFHIILKADEGVDNVSITSGSTVTKLGKGMVYDSDKGIYYNAFTATVKAGTYTVSYTLKNGYGGTATLSGDGVSGMTFKAAGTPTSDKGIDISLQLSGIEKSGYVDPVEPQKEDNSLKVTDYLLIVLVILVVVLAVIVAMRLMRS